jgi:hypothetical protein
MDFQSHDPPCSVEFQSTLPLKHGVSVHAGYGDEDFFFDQRSGVCAVQVFQGPAAATGLRQAKSYVGEFSGFRDRYGNFHGVAAFNVAIIIRGIERGLERDVVVEPLFLRIVNTTRDSKGHKRNGIFITFCVKSRTPPVPLGKTFETQRKRGNGGMWVVVIVATWHPLFPNIKFQICNRSNTRTGHPQLPPFLGVAKVFFA